MNQLTVYKASAGSGKTFTLAREYMTLVIKEPMAYRNILAVTFTNKATEEMKNRILSKLYSIAHRLEDAKDYMVGIQKTLPDYSEEQIITNAGIALSNLVHNYNYFRVVTIDTFFQGVLRNLARELDLTANLRVWLNDDQTEQMAVDELIAELQVNDKLLLWILDYIKENIADDKSWNVIGQIKAFGRTIFKDYYKENADRLNECLAQEGFFDKYIEKLRKKRKKAKGKFDTAADEFFEALAQNNLTADDFQSKKRGIWSYFNKIKNGKYDDEDVQTATLANCMEKAENWVTKANAHPGNPAYDLVVSKLHKHLCDTEKARPEWLRTFKSADLTMRHLNQLRLLGSIDRKVREMNKEANRFLLSDTQTLLHSLIQDHDSPFVFEKIGAQLDHVMIDEFQDTSTVQWKNFKVLLRETMSRQDAGNLIVGDVKQSIYRWRAGDWRLLNNIDAEFPTPPYNISLEPLSVNYRSDRNIIEFNNAFFTIAARKEYEQLVEASDDNIVKKQILQEAEQLDKAYRYNNVRQKVPKKKQPDGYIRVHLLAQAARSSNEGETYQDQMMRMTLDTIRELVDKGVKYKNIAILVRSNRLIQDIADYLMSHSDYPLVSDEAFRLDASQAVNLLVLALYHLTHPEDKIVIESIKHYIDKYGLGDDIEQSFFGQRETLLQEPLYELAERIYCLFHLGTNEIMKRQSAYVCAFFDQLHKFLADNGNDIGDFLEEWYSNIHTKSIHSDKKDGIQLLSIHKSKGLEFDNVIMPFCDWTLEKTDTIWCSPQETPYNELPLVPVDFSAKKMKGSIYESDYQHEHLQNVVDNLNLLYVAFTRAGRNLFVYGKRGSAALRSCVIEKSLSDVNEMLTRMNNMRKEGKQPQRWEGCPVENSGKKDGKKTEKKDEDLLFEYGVLDTKEKVEKENHANAFDQVPQDLAIHIETRPELHQFVPSQKSIDFINGDDEQDEQQEFYIKLGTVLHALFSTIATQDDIEKSLRQLELDGVLYDENVSKERIENMLRKRLNSPLVSDWFSSRWKVMNECSLLYKGADGKAYKERPDRVLIGQDELVVIDFKFGKQRSEHHQQVKRYMEAFVDMGYQNVKGYLWYVYPNKVVEVN